MRKLLLIALLLSCTINAQNIDYELEYNDAMSRYEIYITRDVTAAAPLLNSGVSRITVVFPTNAGRTLSHTSESVDSYSQLAKITAPAAQPGSDFHTFTSNGGSPLIGILDAGVRVLWLSFTASDGCVADNIRLYENGSDPDSSAPGMNGSDRSQGYSTLSVSGALDEYRQNLGSPVDCSTLSNNDIEETPEFAIYPNPVNDIATIAFGNNVNDANISLHNLTGKLIYKESNVVVSNNEIEIDVSKISPGVYILIIENNSKLSNQRLIVY